MRVESGLVVLLDAPADPYPSSDEVRGSFSDAMIDEMPASTRLVDLANASVANYGRNKQHKDCSEK